MTSHVDTNMSRILNKNYCMILAFVLFGFFMPTVESCYITNCPWGGKRSLPESQITFHTCRKCANGEGTCFGPNICCGLSIGCLIDTRESSVCRLEDVKSKEPCNPYGKKCKSLSYGKCATSSMCCNPEGCTMDPECGDDQYPLESSDYSNGLGDQQPEMDIDRDLIKTMKEYLENRMQKLQKQQKKIQEIETLDSKNSDKQRAQPSDSEFFD